MTAGPPSWVTGSASTAGVPGSGGPPRAPSPPRRGTARLLTLVIVAGLAALGLFGFVLEPRFALREVLDGPAVERGVARVVTDDWRRRVEAVQCPDGMAARAGTSFRCGATVDGRPRSIPVDVLDDTGTYQVGQPR